MVKHKKRIDDAYSTIEILDILLDRWDKDGNWTALFVSYLEDALGRAFSLGYADGEYAAESQF